MGMQTPSIQQPQGQSSGKGMQTQIQPNGGLVEPGPSQNDVMTNDVPTSFKPQPVGKGGSVSFPSQSGQPRMGQPNNYSNTVGPWDNANIQPRQTQSGKGKGY